MLLRKLFFNVLDITGEQKTIIQIISQGEELATCKLCNAETCEMIKKTVKKKQTVSIAEHYFSEKICFSCL